MKCNVKLLHPPVPPFESVCAELLAATRELTGFDQTAVAFATEAPFLANLGMETVVLGPGSINQAHQPNEYIELDQLQTTIDIIRGLIRKYCFLTT